MFPTSEALGSIVPIDEALGSIAPIDEELGSLAPLDAARSETPVARDPPLAAGRFRVGATLDLVDMLL